MHGIICYAREIINYIIVINGTMQSNKLICLSELMVHDFQPFPSVGIFIGADPFLCVLSFFCIV